jgi:hypothetical protein
MSWQATTAVTRHSKHSGSELLCLLMLANYADAHGESIFPSIPTLAKDCRMSVRGVRYIMAKLVESKELVQTGTHQRGVKVYRIVLPDLDAPLQSLQVRKSTTHARPMQNSARPMQSSVSTPAIAFASKRKDQSEKEESRGFPFRNEEERNQLLPVPDNGFVAAWKIRDAYRVADAAFFADGTPWATPSKDTMESLPERTASK